MSGLGSRSTCRGSSRDRAVLESSASVHCRRSVRRSISPSASSSSAELACDGTPATIALRRQRWSAGRVADIATIARDPQEIHVVETAAHAVVSAVNEERGALGVVGTVGAPQPRPFVPKAFAQAWGAARASICGSAETSTPRAARLFHGAADPRRVQHHALGHHVWRQRQLASPAARLTLPSPPSPRAAHPAQRARPPPCRERLCPRRRPSRGHAARVHWRSSGRHCVATLHEALVALPERPVLAWAEIAAPVYESRSILLDPAQVLVVARGRERSRAGAAAGLSSPGSGGAACTEASRATSRRRRGGGRGGGGRGAGHGEGGGRAWRLVGRGAGGGGWLASVACVSSCVTLPKTELLASASGRGRTTRRLSVNADRYVSARCAA